MGNLTDGQVVNFEFLETILIQNLKQISYMLHLVIENLHHDNQFSGHNINFFCCLYLFTTETYDSFSRFSTLYIFVHWQAYQSLRWEENVWNCLKVLLILNVAAPENEKNEFLWICIRKFHFNFSKINMRKYVRYRFQDIDNKLCPKSEVP